MFIIIAVLFFSSAAFPAVKVAELPEDSEITALKKFSEGILVFYSAGGLKPDSSSERPGSYSVVISTARNGAPLFKSKLPYSRFMGVSADGKYAAFLKDQKMNQLFGKVFARLYFYEIKTGKVIETGEMLIMNGQNEGEWIGSEYYANRKLFSIRNGEAAFTKVSDWSGDISIDKNYKVLGTEVKKETEYEYKILLFNLTNDNMYTVYSFSRPEKFDQKLCEFSEMSPHFYFKAGYNPAVYDAVGKRSCIAQNITYKRKKYFGYFFTPQSVWFYDFFSFAVVSLRSMEVSDIYTNPLGDQVCRIKMIKDGKVFGTASDPVNGSPKSAFSYDPGKEKVLFSDLPGRSIGLVFHDSPGVYTVFYLDGGNALMAEQSRI
ncbi:MAG: hypothetical protein ACLFQK_07070 [Fibrobacterota bacterium]